MLFIGGALVSSAPTQPHTLHGLKPNKRRLPFMQMYA